jgi:hypothetical protein
VNEAAVIAAGFEYRAVRDVSCLPDCFSRPVSDYAVYLNDLMLHRVRNDLLMPFVTRLPGTSDSPWIEAKRAEFIVIETARRIVAAEYDEIWHKPAVATKCRTVRSVQQVSSVMAKAKTVLPLECAREMLHAGHRCLSRDFRIGSPCAAAAKVSARSFRNKLGPDADRKIWQMAISILEEAILLGRHNGIGDPVAAVERLERAKAPSVPVSRAGLGRPDRHEDYKSYVGWRQAELEAAAD